MKNPIEEFLGDHGQTKEAGVGQALRSGFNSQEFGKAVAGGAGAAAVSAAIGAGALGAKAIYQAATKARNFRQMLSHNEDLREHHETDPRRFNQLYSSLHTMNPEFARDPIVSGTYMRQMLESPMNAGGILAQTVPMRDKFPSLIDRSADDAMSVAKSRLGRRPSGSDQV